MKKQLLWGMTLIIAGFSSCQKDTFKPAAQTSVGSNDKLRIAVTNPGTYNELTLLARQPGENFDTYVGNWGGVSIKMQATPFWNHDQYPNLVNGVPCTGGSYSVGDQNQIGVSTGGGKDIFIVGVATASFSNQQAFINDLNNYNNALDAYDRKVVAGTVGDEIRPQASTYVKASYGGGGASIVQVTGKIIRITTGSHFAFASVDYPEPEPVVTTSPTSFSMSFVYPAGSNYEYDVSVNNGLITSVMGLNRATYQNFLAHYNSGGTWARIAGTTHYHITGLNVTGTPAGSPVTFAFTGDSEDAY